jgi:transposase
MQGHKQCVDKVVLRVQLSERVPKKHLYRRLTELLNWDFLYQRTRALYSHTGQPLLDPVVFFKLMLVSRLENLISDHLLVEHCSLRLDILYFRGYEVDEDLSWHLTISRTRQLYLAAVFEQLFEHVFAQSVAAGLVTGYTQTVDSAFVKAKTRWRGSMKNKLLRLPHPRCTQPASCCRTYTPAPAAVSSSPAHQLQRLASTHARYLRNLRGPLRRGRPQAHLLSDKTH